MTGARLRLELACRQSRVQGQNQTEQTHAVKIGAAGAVLQRLIVTKQSVLIYTYISQRSCQKSWLWFSKSLHEHAQTSEARSRDAVKVCLLEYEALEDSLGVLGRDCGQWGHPRPREVRAVCGVDNNRRQLCTVRACGSQVGDD